MSLKIKRYLFSKETLIILIIFIFALIVRIIYLNQISDNPFFIRPIVDCYTYHLHALSIIEGNTPIDGPYFQAPLYYYFLALLYKLFSVNFYTVRLIQFLIGSINCVLTYILGKRLFGKWVGIISGGVLAIYGTVIFFDGELLSPVLIIFFNLLLLITLLSTEKRPNLWLFFLSGIFLGLSAITKANVLLFGIFIPFWILTILKKKNYNWRKIFLMIVIFISGTILIITPITIRNYIQSKTFVLISSNFGINFYIGSNSDYDQTVGVRPGYTWEKLIGEAKDSGCKTDIECSRYFTKKALKWITENPLSYLKLLIHKIYLFINGNEILRNQRIYPFREYSSLLSILLWKWGIAFPYGIILPLGIMGILLALLKKKNITIPAIFIVLHILSIIIFFVCARYRLPVIPLLIITGVFGIKSLIISFKERVYRDVIIGSVVLVVFLIISNYNTGEMKNEFTADTYYNLGMHYVEELDMIEAESLFKKAVEIRPFYPEANGGLGLIYFERGEYKKALKYYQKSLEKHPEFTKSLINSGTLYIRMGNTEKAIEYYERALITQPQNENIKRYLFLANKRLEEINKEDVGENIQELLRIEDEYKNDPRYLNALGVAYINEGLYRAGAEYLSRAVLLMPENPVPHYNLGIALMNTGDFEYATKEFQEVLKLDPSNESAKEYISRMREDMNKGK